MKIEAATVEAHRFGSVRRKGYDPVEVDRVMDRLVATLRSYESDTEALEARVRDADDSIDAIRRTFVAAQRTKQEMLDEGAALADSMVAKAQEDAESRLETARTEIDGLYFERDQVVIEAHGRWQEVVTEAEEASFEALLDAEMARVSAIGDRERILEASERSAGARLRNASDEANRVIAEADDIRTAADTDRTRVLEETEREAESRLTNATQEADRIANEIVGEASREELRISARLDHMRAAITEVETKIHDLAAAATPYTEQIADIIDLTDVEEDQPLTGTGRS